MPPLVPPTSTPGRARVDRVAKARSEAKARAERERRLRLAEARAVREARRLRAYDTIEDVRARTTPSRKLRTPKEAEEIARRNVLPRIGDKPYAPAAAGLPYVDEDDIRELEHAITGIPAGLYELGKAVVLDVAKPRRGPFSFRETRTLPILEGMGEAMARDIRDPLRNPLLTALTLSAALSAGAGTAARAGAATRAARTAAQAGRSPVAAALGAAVKRPLPDVRIHYYEGQPIRGRYSRDAGARAIQRAHDKVRLEIARRRVDRGAEERISTIGARKAERLLSEERRLTDAAAKAPALRVLAAARRISTPEDLAIRLAAEGINPDDFIRYHLRKAQEVEEAAPQHLRKAALAEEARKYLDLGEDGRPFISERFPKLRERYRLTEKAALTRERRAIEMGVLLPEQAEFRKHAPAEIVEGARLEGGRFRVPDVLRSKPPHGPIGYRGGLPRKPGTLTHSYTGALRETGKFTTQTMKAVAEDAIEFERYASVYRFANRIHPMGRVARPADTRFRKWSPVLIRRQSKAEAKHLREVLESVDPEKLSPDEAARVEAAIKAWERQLFPEEGVDIPKARPGDVIPGVVWVDERLLASQRRLIHRVPAYDVIADATKGAIIYGKPGYFLPNVLGNVAFNIIQQGFLAPVNWYRAVRLPKDLAWMIDEVMGHGFARALAEGTRSPISTAVNKMGNFWSLFVDIPFRRAAFIHEARARGFKTHAQQRQLIMSTRHRSDLAEIAQRARDSIVDYERMGPIERDALRRIVFVYPWVKGSTYYAAQFMRDHPILAIALARIGQMGLEEAERDLGPLPAWARGSFKVFERDGMPFVINPATVSPFATAAQVIAGARGGFQTVERSETIAEAANPVLQAIAEAAAGRDLFTGRELKGGFLRVFPSQVLKGTPQYRLYHRIERADEPGTQEKAYPFGVRSAIGQFVIGGASPRPANLEELARLARKPPTVEERLREEMAGVITALRVKNPDLFRQDPALAGIIRDAYMRKIEIEVLRQDVRRTTQEGEDYYREVLSREADTLRRWGVIDSATAMEIKRIAKRGSLGEVKSLRGAVIGVAMDLAYLETIREAKKAAGGEEIEEEGGE